MTSEIQSARMTSSPNVTVRSIENQGHAGQFEVTKDALRDMIADWLERNSL
jgi:hypothetical protein